ncbi:hypothetical protein, unlikely [Trypanosoma brucei gambiense DAL972]|uniref:Uncharacterized protein n=1 Tax=Trypanosoma brucei gambiense (strain MHOM/CI/86/DAL972) TaxID=679716 RepID=C9ZVV6_TRYB9|nr:hypothetical protein, unlikely [Trypanosoma brucei gambiense DAL972]CBH13544.1 hypothetical protein, unlikely [Trypanosoma brucei gambiense DAL972]|eukprot:XP_011775821.1 hypothetical protein, unlikely [Trypanosoma brucei gambiense DAL972]
MFRLSLIQVIKLTLYIYIYIYIYIMLFIISFAVWLITGSTVIGAEQKKKIKKICRVFATIIERKGESEKDACKHGEDNFLSTPVMRGQEGKKWVMCRASAEADGTKGTRGLHNSHHPPLLLLFESNITFI